MMYTLAMLFSDAFLAPLKDSSEKFRLFCNCEEGQDHTMLGQIAEQRFAVRSLS